ncbi:MAG: hypothetical protein GC184_14700 [Rhizobiales bacterium]|nr:hypothetical protein [Hyphomicrobiales bacterium]
MTEHEGPVSEEDWAAHRQLMMQSMPLQLMGGSIPDVLLPYQKRLLQSTAIYSLTVSDKSRRIGFTWGVGSDAVLTSGAQKSAGGMDTLYIGYNLDMAREFIDTCAMWAKAFMPACSEVSEYLFLEEGEKGTERAIKAFRISFASGFEIVALSSRPRSLRGRQGFVILDEFAFHDDAAGLLKAAMALLIWGGKVLVISTHNGADNPFNELIEEIRQKRRPGNVVRCTFDEAIEQGLYQRICLVTGKTWSPEAEAKWRAEIRASYGDDAAEELDCIPSQGTGVYLTQAQITACMEDCIPVISLSCPKGFEQGSDEARDSFVAAWLEENIDPLLKAMDRDLATFYGQDFGRLVDLSVITPLQEQRDMTLRTPFVVELNNVPFREQEKILKFIVDGLPRFVAGKIDATGNGLYLGERAVQKYGAAFEAVMLSDSWYLANMPPFKAHIQDRTIVLPKKTEIRDDLRKIKQINGVPKIARDDRTIAQNGGKRHGDAAVAYCLAVAAASSEPVEFAYHSVTPRSPMALGTSYDDDDDDAGDVSMRGLLGNGAF